MLTDRELIAANSYGEALRVALHERELPNNNRVRAAAGCHAIAQDHHHAMIVLLDARLYASVMVLVRAVFEAYVRGQWLALCATDGQVRKFLKGREPPKIEVMLEQLRQQQAFRRGTLSLIKAKTWKGMCAYAHTGGVHVQRWQTEDGIEPNYSRAEVIEALRMADILAALSVLGVLMLAEDADSAQKVLELFTERMGEHGL